MNSKNNSRKLKRWERRSNSSCQTTWTTTGTNKKRSDNIPLIEFFNQTVLPLNCELFPSVPDIQCLSVCICCLLFYLLFIQRDKISDVCIFKFVRLTEVSSWQIERTVHSVTFIVLSRVSLQFEYVFWRQGETQRSQTILGTDKMLSLTHDSGEHRNPILAGRSLHVLARFYDVRSNGLILLG